MNKAKAIPLTADLIDPSIKYFAVAVVFALTLLLLLP